MNIKQLAWKLEYHSKHPINDIYYYIFFSFFFFLGISWGKFIKKQKSFNK